MTNACAGCGHIRSHHPGLSEQLRRPCEWRGCGCPWFVQRIDLGASDSPASVSPEQTPSPADDSAHSGDRQEGRHG